LAQVRRGRHVAEHLLARHRQHDLQDVLDVRDVAHAAFPLEQLGSHRVVAVLGEAPGDVLHPLVHAPDLRDHDHDRSIGGVRGPRLVHRHLVAADRDRRVAGHDALGIGLDRLAERFLDAHRVAGEGGGAADG